MFDNEDDEIQGIVKDYIAHMTEVARCGRQTTFREVGIAIGYPRDAVDFKCVINLVKYVDTARARERLPLLGVLIVSRGPYGLWCWPSGLKWFLQNHGYVPPGADDWMSVAFEEMSRTMAFFGYVEPDLSAPIELDYEFARAAAQFLDVPLETLWPSFVPTPVIDG